MTILQFIEKAIEGGWQNKFFVNWMATTPAERKQMKEARANACLLDPLAWQAVGKVEGWEGNEQAFNHWPLWHWNMSQMVHALCEGKTIEQFLATL